MIRPGQTGAKTWHFDVQSSSTAAGETTHLHLEQAHSNPEVPSSQRRLANRQAHVEP